MVGFVNFCQQLVPLDPSAEAELTSKLRERTYAKGSLLLNAGEVCKKLYFIEYGLVKTCFIKEDKEFIMRFFAEDSMFTVLDSFTTQQVATYSVLALEQTHVTSLTKVDLTLLCQKHHCIEAFFSRLVTLASVNMMKRLSEMLEENARERYTHFIKENGSLAQRISLGNLASYLGITQVTLSRIRAKQ